jgi:hypothetical protein
MIAFPEQRALQTAAPIVKERHEMAAVALHYAYYNFVKFNSSIRSTPAMAAGVTKSAWTVRDWVEMIEA